MLTSIRGTIAASLISGFALSATPVFANENIPEDEFDLAFEYEGAEVPAVTSEPQAAAEPVSNAESSRYAPESSLTFSGNVALVSEYRFRGIDLSGGEFAIQGGIDVSHTSGLYAGVWGSSLDDDSVRLGDSELDVYVGYGGSLAEGFSFDLGGIVYIFPDADTVQSDYVEFYGSVGFEFGPTSQTVGVAYAPDQEALGNTDNLYFYYDLSAGIPQTPLTVTLHLGYTDGALTFTDDRNAFDWSIGVDAVIKGPVSVGVAYVGAQDDIPSSSYDFADDAVVFSLSASF